MRKDRSVTLADRLKGMALVAMLLAVPVGILGLLLRLHWLAMLAGAGVMLWIGAWIWRQPRGSGRSNGSGDTGSSFAPGDAVLLTPTISTSDSSSCDSGGGSDGGGGGGGD